MIRNLEENKIKPNLSVPYGQAKLNLPLERLNNSYENLLISRKETQTYEKFNSKNLKLKISNISEFNSNFNINLLLKKEIVEPQEIITNTKKIKIININKTTENKIILNRDLIYITDKQRKGLITKLNTNISFNEIINIRKKMNNYEKIHYKFINNELKLNLNHLSKFNPYLAQSKHVYYFFKKSSSKLNLIKNISSIIESSFLKMYSLISKPVYSITPNNLDINLFFFLIKNKIKNKNKNKNNYNYNYSQFLNLNTKNLEVLSANLSNFYQKQVHIDINRIRSIYFDSNILATFLARFCDIKNKKFTRIADKILYFSKIQNKKFINSNYNGIIPSFLTGINLKFAGRLSRQKLVSRKTVKITQRGSLTRATTDFISKSRINGINKKGTFCITATIGHKIYI